MCHNKEKSFKKQLVPFCALFISLGASMSTADPAKCVHVQTSSRTYSGAKEPFYQHKSICIANGNSFDFYLQTSISTPNIIDDQFLTAVSEVVTQVRRTNDQISSIDVLVGSKDQIFYPVRIVTELQNEVDYSLIRSSQGILVISNKSVDKEIENYVFEKLPGFIESWLVENPLQYYDRPCSEDSSDKRLRHCGPKHNILKTRESKLNLTLDSDLRVNVQSRKFIHPERMQLSLMATADAPNDFSIQCYFEATVNPITKEFSLEQSTLKRCFGVSYRR